MPSNLLYEIRAVQKYWIHRDIKKWYILTDDQILNQLVSQCGTSIRITFD